jgi:multidrug resistance efflux pump
MVRWLGISLAAILALSTALIAEDELPANDADETFEVEPPILIPNRDLEPDSTAEAATSAVPAGLQRLEKDLEQAKRTAGGAERLYKIGVLAKVEVEQRTLRMIRLQSEVENARVAVAKEEFEVLQKATSGETSKDALQEAANSLARAISAAHSAAANRERAEIEFAEANVRRQRLLLARGIGRKSEVAKAEEKLAELKAQKN